MIRFATSLCLFSWLSVGVIFGQGIKSRIDLRQIPVRASVAWQFKQAEINKPVTVTVTLKDIHGATVPAVKDEKVQLKYQNQIFGAIIAAGQTSVTFQITPKATTVEKVEVTTAD